MVIVFKKKSLIVGFREKYLILEGVLVLGFTKSSLTMTIQGGGGEEGFDCPNCLQKKKN